MQFLYLGAVVAMATLAAVVLGPVMTPDEPHGRLSSFIGHTSAGFDQAKGRHALD